jgi:type IV secretory pathway TraG/TraD family ATPase VirD4
MRGIGPGQAILGALLAVVVALFAWTLLYATIAHLRSGDTSVVRALLTDDLFASFSHAWARRWQREAQLNALMAAAGALLVAGVLTVVALQRRASPLGDASFMTAPEARRAGFLGRDGLFFGRLGGVTLSRSASFSDPKTGRRERVRKVRLMFGRWLRHPRLVHAFVVGPTRSGKGTGLIIPNALLWSHSLVVLDIRGETFEETAGQRARFSKVYRFAPGQARSHGYNPLDFVRAGPGLRESDIRAIAASMVPTLGQDDEYWTNDARELVAGIIAYVLESRRVREKTLRSVVAVLMGETYVIDRLARIVLEEGDALSPFARRSITPFLAMAEKQFSGLYGNLRVALQPFANELSLRATSFSSFRLADFRREATTLYLDFRLSEVAAIAPVVNLLLTQLVNHLTEDRMKAGERPVLMLLDEFANLGRLEPVLGMWKVLAGNGVAVWAFVQSLTDLDRFYGKDGRGVLLDNSELQIFLGGQSPEALEHFEKLLGQRTVTLRSRSTSGGFMSQSRSHSTSTREAAVPLLSRDALRRLDPDRFVVLPLGEKPILARKNPFFGDNRLRRLAGLRMPKGWRLPDLGDGQPQARAVAPPRQAQQLTTGERAIPPAPQPGAVFRAMAPDTAPLAPSPRLRTPSPAPDPQPTAPTERPSAVVATAMAELATIAGGLRPESAGAFQELLAAVASRAAELDEPGGDALKASSPARTPAG